MSHKRKGMLKTSTEWAVHLRRFGKKLFWRQHRQIEKKEAKKEANNG
jgi:hypothetical protein